MGFRFKESRISKKASIMEDSVVFYTFKEF